MSLLVCSHIILTIINMSEKTSTGDHGGGVDEPERIASNEDHREIREFRKDVRSAVVELAKNFDNIHEDLVDELVRIADSTSGLDAVTLHHVIIRIRDVMAVAYGLDRGMVGDLADKYPEGS